MAGLMAIGYVCGFSMHYPELCFWMPTSWAVVFLIWGQASAKARAMYPPPLFRLPASGADKSRPQEDMEDIVLDEIAGLMLCALALPENSPFWLALAFVLFRIFDIWKPWPIREVDHRLAGGAGIMLDDLMAAVYAAVCLLGLTAFLPTT